MKKFECPLSPHIRWYAGLSYIECPLISSERDMGACQNCHLRGENAPAAKMKKQRKKHQEEVSDKRNQRKKEEVPTINGTYVDE